MEINANQIITDFNKLIAPLEKEANLAQWDASISGSDADFSRCEEAMLKLEQALSNQELFNRVKAAKEHHPTNDAWQARQLEVIHHIMHEKQVPIEALEELVRLETHIEKLFATFRVSNQGKQISDNEVEELLQNSTNSAQLESVWKGSKKLGSLVADDVRQLVRKRNDIAHKLGFPNYHNMSLSLSEQNPADIDILFDELDTLTAAPFAELKMEIDTFLAQRFGIAPNELMPWHYMNRFFQEAPQIYGTDINTYFKDQDLAALTASYFQSIGLPIDELIAQSDLHEKPGKNQHAFCISMDRGNDVRVLCNIKPNQYWMDTMLHEYGHAVYDRYMPQNIPFVLREPAHTFTTEAIAMMFGRMGGNAQWMQDMLGIAEHEKTALAEELHRTTRLQQLVFSRWSQLMYRFEKAMYADPNQDLNALWWDLAEKYQLLTRPSTHAEQDWASKIHIATVPCYYHNYLLGELLASQLHHYITTQIIGSNDLRNQSYKGRKDIGEFLLAKIFAPGKTLHWSSLIEQATGSKLSARFYAEQFL